MTILRRAAAAFLFLGSPRHIIDGPSDFTCEPFPEACADAPDCDCLEAEACPETLQACGADDGGLLVLECVEG